RSHVLRLVTAAPAVVGIARPTATKHVTTPINAPRRNTPKPCMSLPPLDSAKPHGPGRAPAYRSILSVCRQLLGTEEFAVDEVAPRDWAGRPLCRLQVHGDVLGLEVLLD